MSAASKSPGMINVVTRGLSAQFLAFMMSPLHVHVQHLFVVDWLNFSLMQNRGDGSAIYDNTYGNNKEYRRRQLSARCRSAIGEGHEQNVRTTNAARDGDEFTRPVSFFITRHQ